VGRIDVAVGNVGAGFASERFDDGTAQDSMPSLLRGKRRDLAGHVLEPRGDELSGESLEDACRGVLVDHAPAPGDDGRLAEVREVSDLGHVRAGKRAKIEHGRHATTAASSFRVGRRVIAGGTGGPHGVHAGAAIVPSSCIQPTANAQHEERCGEANPFFERSLMQHAFVSADTAGAGGAPPSAWSGPASLSAWPSFFASQAAIRAV
jgi:hypothetical protein